MAEVVQPDGKPDPHYRDVTLTASPTGIDAARVIKVPAGLYELILPCSENGAYLEWSAPSPDGKRGWSTRFLIGQRTDTVHKMELKGLPTRSFTKEEAWAEYTGHSPQFFDAPQPPGTGGGAILLIALATNCSDYAQGSMTIRLKPIKTYEVVPPPEDEEG